MCNLSWAPNSGIINHSGVLALEWAVLSLYITKGSFTIINIYESVQRVR